MGTETIFTMKHFNYYMAMVEEFENMDKFKEGVSRRRTNCLTSGTELGQWCMDATSTRTGNIYV